jgi:integrase
MGRDGTGVKKATESSIQIEFTYKGIRCRERIKLKPTAANLKKCERHRESIIYAIENDTFDYSVTFPDSKARFKFSEQTALTAGEWLRMWLNKKEPMIKSSTWTGYYKIIKNQLIPAFGTIPLAELKKKDVRQWCETLTCSNKRIANIISPLRDALQHAYDDELINDNPLYNFRFKRAEKPKVSDIDPFTAEEQHSILSVLDGQAKNLIKFAFWTGLRTSELIAIEWQDVDFIKEVIKINRARTQAASKPETTKTKAGEREVKLLPPALDAIFDQKKYTFLEGKQIFYNPRTDKPWTGDQPIRRTLWQPALKLAGVRYRRPYQTRHSYASYLLSSGENIAWISNQLGHSNVLVTAKVYARFMADAAPKAGENAVKIFWNKQEQ